MEHDCDFAIADAEDYFDMKTDQCAGRSSGSECHVRD